MNSANDAEERQARIDRTRVVLLMPAQFLVVALLMFVPAGDLGWRKGWLNTSPTLVRPGVCSSG
jgi:hypothetical protein